MKELQVFNYNQKQIRAVQLNDEMWFVLKDVCDVLGISIYRDVADRLDEDERALAEVDTLGGVQNMVVVNESGLYNVILRSDKPEAKPFRKWVTSEVLPSIRKTGGYQTKAMTTAQMFAMQAKVNLEQEQRLAALENRAERTEQTMQKTLDIFSAPAVSPDDWTSAMNHQINTLVEQYGGNHRKFRSDRYAELELETGVDLKCRQTRLRNRMRKNGATETECKQVSILQVISRDRKLRPAFEAIIRRKAASLISDAQM